MAMMAETTCAFCEPETLAWRTTHTGRLITSFVSQPAFIARQCLVIPNRHITMPGELTKDEGAAAMRELGRLSILLDEGFGTGIMQKYQPQQADNGIKVSHLHFHVFPRRETETELFPVPQPNSFDGFYDLNDEEISRLAAKLRNDPGQLS